MIYHMRIIIILLTVLNFGKMKKKTIKTIIEIIKVVVSALLGYFGGNAL